jgi:BarA-like signal transduction histidine kinase
MTGGGGAGIPMQEEAEITINGTRLSDAESMTIRVAVDTLANVLAEDLDAEGDGKALADRYLSALSSIQSLLESRQTRKQ